ncbi:MAG TPA: MotA/TolQ/ExbB proton channel family protein [Polyangiaceae bacterium]|jgi:biopolymer transport protein ExbB/TolQ|nr:MotA/TolQ/ExbB proton channel family protein [Polyangiaceae bacterium]
MDFSLLGLWAQMGGIAKLVVITLLIMSIMAITVSVERLITFRKGRRRSLEYIAALQPLIGTPGRLHEALRLPESWNDAPLARVLGVGLSEYRQGLERLGSHATDTIELEVLGHGVGRSMDRAKKRELAGLGRGLPLLATIASSAPFVGLFGTVFGIITAFEKMADPSKGGGGLATVSAGIAEALLTTAVGLAVAIVAVWFYNFFAAKLDEFGGIIDDSTGELADRLASQSARASHTPSVPAHVPPLAGAVHA